MKDLALGQRIDEIDTPVLLLDLDGMERNIAAMADFFKGLETKLRPHFKTHKTPILAHKQIEAGAIGITCAKLGEAEPLVESGIKDILIANEIVGAAKMRRLVSLAKSSDVMVCVDNARHVEDLSEATEVAGATLRVLVDVDVGMHRCGAQPGELALALAQKVERAKGLKFVGLMGYEGHTVHMPDFQERKKAAERSMKFLIETKELVEDAGLEVGIVSGGGTGTYQISGTYPGVTEVQPGSYIVMDTQYKSIEGMEAFEIAISVLTTVISRPQPNIAITDGGLKVMTREFGLPLVKGLEGAKLLHLSEEHGKLELEGEARSLRVGDKIEFLPSHCCTTINLHDYFYGVTDGRLEVVWEIAGRGKSR